MDRLGTFEGIRRGDLLLFIEPVEPSGRLSLRLFMGWDGAVPMAFISHGDTELYGLGHPNLYRLLVRHVDCHDEG